MFNVQDYGWCRLKFEDREFLISDLTLIFPQWIEQMEFALKNETPLALFMDGEGEDAYLIADKLCSYFICNQGETTLTESDMSLKDIVSEFIKDVEENINLWKRWGCFDEDQDNVIDFSNIKKFL